MLLLVLGAEPGATLDWTQYGPLVVACVVACGWLAKLYLDERRETRRLNGLLIDFAERLAPLLADATRALSETEKGMAAAMQAVDSSRSRSEVGDLMVRLDGLARRLEER